MIARSQSGDGKKNVACMGLFPKFRDKSVGLQLSTYAEMCSIDEGSEYVAALYDNTMLTQFFTKTCTGCGVRPKKDKDPWLCVPCKQL